MDDKKAIQAMILIKKALKTIKNIQQSNDYESEDPIEDYSSPLITSK